MEGRRVRGQAVTARVSGIDALVESAIGWVEWWIARRDERWGESRGLGLGLGWREMRV
jgi:hypothetical protein